MQVELPTTGCNIIQSATSFYNYNSGDTVRDTYVIFDGKALLQSHQTNQYGYSYTGTCLSTGDLVYKPELPIYFQFMSMILVAAAFGLVFKYILRKVVK